MLYFLPAPLRGTLAFGLHTLNTLFCCVPLFSLALLKLLMPVKAVRRLISKLLNGIAVMWISTNAGIHRLTKNMRWHVQGADALVAQEWYLVIANHQSWADIMVLQQVLNRRIPFLKFFLKQELLYVPVLGLAWWALDFPFMRRFTKTYLAQHPEMKGKDSETTRKACEKFRRMPIAVMNFVEGTRMTADKKARQQSPYQHLLKPKAGGIGLVMSAMGDQLHKVLDVTIVYGNNRSGYWDFLCGRTEDIYVHIRTLDVTPALCGDYDNDSEYRIGFQRWLNELWLEKDRRIAGLIEQAKA